MTASRLAERLLQLLPVLLGVSLIVFLMITLTPGDPVEIMLADQRATEEQAASLRHDLGLDRPIAERFLVFLGNALRGDFGISFFHRRPVWDVIALIVAILVAIPLGVAAAVKRDTWLDRVLSAASLFGVSLPGFWFGILLILLFAVEFQLLPVGGRISFDFEVPRTTGFLLIDTLLAGDPGAFGNVFSHLVLPAITLGLPTAALLARVVRSAMAEVLASDYVLFAQAKGLSRRRVLLRHALKNALIPAVTVTAIETGSLLGGNMIVETVFGWPGLGRLVVESIFARNYPLVQAAVLLYALTYVLLNFVADLLYTALNPKVRL
jgi:peptide/nickel transport system permease protein